MALVLAKSWRASSICVTPTEIFWAFFRDTQDHFKDAVDHFGLVRHDFTPKAAYAAYRAAARRLTPS